MSEVSQLAAGRIPASGIACVRIRPVYSVPPLPRLGGYPFRVEHIFICEECSTWNS
jgi:hypothetical protein